MILGIVSKIAHRISKKKYLYLFCSFCTRYWPLDDVYTSYNSQHETRFLTTVMGCLALKASGTHRKAMLIGRRSDHIVLFYLKSACVAGNSLSGFANTQVRKQVVEPRSRGLTRPAAR
jgi:hypothetical protein